MITLFKRLLNEGIRLAMAEQMTTLENIYNENGHLAHTKNTLDGKQLDRLYGQDV